MRYLFKVSLGIGLGLWLQVAPVAAVPAQGRGAGETQTAAAAALAPVTVAVDATDAPRGVFHTRLVIPASPGPLTLAYPKWIPGEHGPTGPIMQLVGLKITAGGKAVAWRRDPIEMFAFHCEVPAGARSLEVSFDYLSPSAIFQGGYGESPNATAQLLVLLWNHVLLYPQGRPTDELTYRASLRLPAGWKYGTALPVAREERQAINFEPVSLTTLVDSPLIAGVYFRSIPLTDERESSVRIDMVADSAGALEMPAESVTHYKQLVSEAMALFGARHYRNYHFLLTLSDAVLSNGLEHHESSDNRVPERTLIDEVSRGRRVTLLPHEYTHSWNGKYRRPAGLATPDYQQPMQGELLWVYEGMTQYIGNLLLTSRSGLRTPEQTRDYLAYVAANLDNNRPGRNWRPLADTATAAQFLYNAPTEGQAARRGVDFYDEGLLVWLEADTIIRRQSGGRRSLDDFCRSFHGGQSGAPAVRPYTFDDVVAAFNEVVPYDWRGFFTARVFNINARPPLGGVEASGWKLVYTDTPNWYSRAGEQVSNITDASFSIGLLLESDGAVRDIIPGLAAAEEGIRPGMKIVAVNGRKLSTQALHNAIKSTKGSPATAPLELLVERAGTYTTYQLKYHEGERYPHLVRDETRADLLGQIIKPLR